MTDEMAISALNTMVQIWDAEDAPALSEVEHYMCRDRHLIDAMRHAAKQLQHLATATELLRQIIDVYYKEHKHSMIFNDAKSFLDGAK